jgi:hypothetical protein
MAVYDRFGRLAFGSPTVPKTVLEYVVFERYLTGMYGKWRLHDKIRPTWAPPIAPVIRSYAMPRPFKVNEEAIQKLESKFKKDDSHLKKMDEEQPPKGDEPPSKTEEPSPPPPPPKLATA